MDWLNQLIPDSGKANALEEFFSSVFTTEDGYGLVPIDVPLVQTMSNINTPQEEILDKFDKLKIDKLPGTDLIHPRALHEVRDATACPSLRHIDQARPDVLL